MTTPITAAKATKALLDGLDIDFVSETIATYIGPNIFFIERLNLLNFS